MLSVLSDPLFIVCYSENDFVTVRTFPHPLAHPFQLKLQNGCCRRHRYPCTYIHFRGRFPRTLPWAVIVWLTIFAISKCQEFLTWAIIYMSVQFRSLETWKGGGGKKVSINKRQNPCCFWWGSNLQLPILDAKFYPPPLQDHRVPWLFIKLGVSSPAFLSR